MNDINPRLEKAPASMLPKRDKLIEDINHYLGYTKEMLSKQKLSKLRAMWNRIDVPEVQNQIAEAEDAAVYAKVSSHDRRREWIDWIIRPRSGL